MYFVTCVPASWASDLLEVERARYHKLELADTKHVRVYREHLREFLDVELDDDGGKLVGLG